MHFARLYKKTMTTFDFLHKPIDYMLGYCQLFHILEAYVAASREIPYQRSTKRLLSNMMRDALAECAEGRWRAVCK